MSNEAVCRTAPATPGLLNMKQIECVSSQQSFRNVELLGPTFQATLRFVQLLLAQVKTKNGQLNMSNFLQNIVAS